MAGEIESGGSVSGKRFQRHGEMCEGCREVAEHYDQEMEGVMELLGPEAPLGGAELDLMERLMFCPRCTRHLRQPGEALCWQCEGAGAGVVTIAAEGDIKW